VSLFAAFGVIRPDRDGAGAEAPIGAAAGPLLMAHAILSTRDRLRLVIRGPTCGSSTTRASRCPSGSAGRQSGRKMQ
jgi:hypothetical protein